VAALDPSGLVFVDESGTTMAMTRRYALAPRGECSRRVPRRHGPNVTLFAALTPAGMGPALTLEGAADGDACGLYLRQLLVPSLRPGQVIILDQLNVHKSAAIRAAMDGAECRLLLLPVYSPNFNPIEQIFAKIKTPLVLPTRARSSAWSPPSDTPCSLSRQPMRGCFAHCGSALPGHLL